MKTSKLRFNQCCFFRLIEKRNSKYRIIGHFISPCLPPSPSAGPLEIPTLVGLTHQSSFPNPFSSGFPIDEAFFSANSELPDLSMLKSSKAYQKGHRSEFLSENMTSGNSEA